MKFCQNKGTFISLLLLTSLVLKIFHFAHSGNWADKNVSPKLSPKVYYAIFKLIIKSVDRKIINEMVLEILKFRSAHTHEYYAKKSLCALCKILVFVRRKEFNLKAFSFHFPIQTSNSLSLDSRRGKYKNK